MSALQLPVPLVSPLSAVLAFFSRGDCFAHLCWCVRYFPTAGFLGWGAESSTLRFGLGCGLGSSALPPVSEASILSSATVGNHEYISSKFFVIFYFHLMFYGECQHRLLLRECHQLTLYARIKKELH